MVMYFKVLQRYNFFLVKKNNSALFYQYNQLHKAKIVVFSFFEPFFCDKMTFFLRWHGF